MSLFLLQDASADPELLEEAVSEEKTLSIFSLIMEGGVGGQIIIALLFVLLMVGLYIYFERFLAIKAASRIDKNYMNQIRDNISSGNLEAAKILSQNNRSFDGKTLFWTSIFKRPLNLRPSLKYHPDNAIITIV